MIEQETHKVSNLKLFEEPVSFDTVKAKILDRIVNNPRAGISQSWFAEVVAEICVELNSIKKEIEVLQVDQSYVEGLRILEKNIKFQEKGRRSYLDSPNNVTLTANESWDPAAGFYSVEWNGEGVPFRWTGPQRSFRFFLNLNRKFRHHVILTILFKPDWINLDEIKCKIDGYEQKCELIEINSTIEMRVSILQSVDSNFIDIDFELPNVKRADHPDPRILGVPVSSLRVKAMDESD